VKWGVFALMIVAILPLSQELRRRPERIVWICLAVGFLPFVTVSYHLLMATVSWPAWPGYSKGVEITLTDFFSIAIILGNPGGLRRIPFLAPMALYLLAALAASASAIYPEASLFYCWQLMRVFIIYLAVFSAVTSDSKAVWALLVGMAFGELLELAVAGSQRFRSGMLQASGTFNSQNELGLVSHFVMFPFFALLLGGRRGWLPLVIVPAALLVDTLTTSRAAAVLGVAGLGLTYALSSLSKWSSRKAMIALAALAIVATITPFAVANFAQRFSESGNNNLGLSEDMERLAYKKAAGMILDDFPGGIGPNQFTFIANVRGYFTRAGVAPRTASRAGAVHNVYWLVLAETGIPGLITYLGFLLFPLFAALRYGLGGIRGSNRDLLLGLAATLIVFCIHSWEEWVPITYTIQSFLAINFGLIAALMAESRKSSLGLPAQPAA
jgi:O-antigen ligase